MRSRLVKLASDLGLMDKRADQQFTYAKATDPSLAIGAPTYTKDSSQTASTNPRVGSTGGAFGTTFNPRAAKWQTADGIGDHIAAGNAQQMQQLAAAPNPEHYVAPPVGVDDQRAVRAVNNMRAANAAPALRAPMYPTQAAK